jgi:carboxyl-terminal processing protease
VSEFKTIKPKSELSNSKKIIILVAVFFGGWLFGAGQVNLKANRTSTQKNLPSNLNYADVERVYDELRASYDGDLDINKLMDGLKQGLVSASGDPYSEYLSPEKATEFSGQLNGTFEGIGAYLGKNDQGNVIVISPVDGFPAKKAGLQPRDVIVEINGEDATAYSVDQAVEKIRGPKGTNVKLRVIRNEKEDLSFDIKREEINIPSVETKVIDNKIGYIKITRFGDDTAELTRQAAEKFKADGVNKVILDLRGNPGGYLDAAVDVSSLWLKNNVVLTERRDGVTIKTYKSRGSAPLLGIPTVVLIDEGSASASEIVAGALKDNNAASLVGVKSFGKGSVQQPQTLENGGILKVTVARWYTPGGKNIDKQGIQPDKTVDISVDDIKAGRDPQLDAAKAQ